MSILVQKDSARMVTSNSTNSKNEILQLERVFAKDMVSALIGATFDKDDTVKLSATNSLHKYGQKAPNLVLNSLYSYLMPMIVTSPQKVDPEKKVHLLESVFKIVDSDVKEINNSCRSQIILLATEELNKAPKKSLASSQSVSSKILVSLSQTDVTDVMQELMKILRPGNLPTEPIIDTLANLCLNNVEGMVKYLDQIYKIIVPMCGLVKGDSMRVVLARLFGNSCEAIIEVLSRQPKQPIQKEEQNTDENGAVVNSQGEVEAATEKTNCTNKFSVETFRNDLEEIYNSINKTTWITSKDLQVSRLTARTLGKLCKLFIKSKLEEVAPKLISLLLSLLRRHNLDQILITKALCDVMASLSQSKSIVLTDCKEQITSVVHNEVCASIVSNEGEISADKAKRFNELLRCFAILAEINLTFLIHQILYKATFRDEKTKCGNLIILRHLINSCDEYMTPNDKELIVKGFHKHLNDSSIKVRHELTKLITAMATHKFLPLDGGREYVRFLVGECSRKVAPVLQEASVHERTGGTQRALEEEESMRRKQREMSMHLINLMALTVDDTEQLFWPYLFEFLLKLNYENALGPVIRVLSNIAQKKSNNGQLENSDENPPKIENIQETEILVRLLVILSDVKSFPDLCCDVVLNLMKNISIYIDERLVGLWNEKIQSLLEYNEGCDGLDKRLMQNTWEEKLLSFLTSTLELISSEEFVCSLSTSLSSQFSLYQPSAHCKNFALRCYGVILRQISNKERVKQDLSFAIEHFIHSSSKDRQGLAMMIGYVASQHFEEVMLELQNAVAVHITARDSSFSFFSVFKSEKSLLEVEEAKSCIALSLGYITYHLPSDVIASKLESDIIKMFVPLLNGLKSSNSKLHAAEAIELIGRSLNNPHKVLMIGDHDAVHMNKQNAEIKPSLKCRDQLVHKLLKYFNKDMNGLDAKEKDAKNFRVMLKNIKIIRGCTTLTELEPTMSEDVVNKMLQSCFNYIMNCEASRKGEISYEEILMTNSREMNYLLTALLKKRKTLQSLSLIFQQFEEFIRSEEPHQRLRAIQFSETLFSSFLSLNFDKQKQANNILSQLLAKILPSCGDVFDDVRLKSLMCVQHLLEILNRCSGVNSDKSQTSAGFGPVLTNVAGKLASNDTETIYNGVKDLAKLVCLRLPLDVLHYQPNTFTSALIDALLCKIQSCANTACLVLVHIFNTKSSLFERKVEQLVTCILSKLEMMPQENNFTRRGVLNLFNILTKQHLSAVLNTILKMSIPFSSSVSECLLEIGSDEVLVVEAISYLCEQLDNNNPYEDASLSSKLFKSNVKKIATKSSLTISLAIEWLVTAQASKLDELQENATSPENVGNQLIASVLIRIGSMCGTKSPHNTKINCYKQAMLLLRLSIRVFFNNQVNSNLENLQVWIPTPPSDKNSKYDGLGFEEFYNKLHLIVKTICNNVDDDSLWKTVQLINKYVNSKYELQRCTVIAFYSLIVQECVESSQKLDLLLDVMINSFQQRLTSSETSPHVRQLCLRGLSNIVYAPEHQITRYGQQVMECLVGGMEDKNDHDQLILLQSMRGLLAILRKFPNLNIDSLVINVVLKARPCFENENVKLRATSFELFSILSNFLNNETLSKYKHQVEDCFIQIVLHLFDDDHAVVKVCKHSLLQLCHVFKNNTLSDLFNKHLLEEEGVDCNQFMSQLAKITLSEGGIGERSKQYDICVQQTIAFFTSSSSGIRSASATLAGYILHTLTEKQRGTINKDQIGLAFTQLLKDSDSNVRSSAAKSISLLYFY